MHELSFCRLNCHTSQYLYSYFPDTHGIVCLMVAIRWILLPKHAVHIHFGWLLACMLAIICLYTSICLHIHLPLSNLCVQLYVSCTMKHYRNTKSYYMKASVNILWSLQCRMMCRVQIGTFIPHLANIPQDVYFNAQADVWTCKTVSIPVARMVCM